MSYQKGPRKFHRERNQKKALLRSLVLSLIKHEKIKTTEAKAREIRPLVEKFITKSKKNTVPNRRLLMTRLHDKEAVSKLMSDTGPHYASRNGGYTRIIKLGNRAGDGSRMAIIEFV